MSYPSFSRNYGGLIWTNHALERLHKRGITQPQALSVIKNPHKTYPGKKTDSVKFIRTVGGRRIHAVATLDQTSHKWIVLSLWVRGENDRGPWLEELLRRLISKLLDKLGIK